MDNQQERSNDLVWLSAMLEAEGSISFQVYTLPDERIRITPFICFVNQDELLLNEVKRIMDFLTKDSTKAKPRWCNHGGGCKQIRLDGMAVSYVLSPLLEYFRGAKKKNAEVIVQYLNLRKNSLLMRDTKGRIQRVGYTKDQVDLVSSIRTHNRAKSSEAICRAPNVVG